MLHAGRVEEVPERDGKEALMKEPWMRENWGTEELHCSGKRGKPTFILAENKNFVSRSFSTPDFKLYSGSEEASPYVSLEKLLDQDEDNPHTSPSNSSSSPSSSSPSSSQDLVGGNPLFRRPPRAAALKRGVQAARPSIALVNRSPAQEDGKAVNCESVGGSSGNDEDLDGIGKTNKESESSRVPGSRRVPDGSYMRRQTEEVQVNRQPVGFDARLAAAVASRALGQQEETFGGSDSDSESSSSSSSESADF